MHLVDEQLKGGQDLCLSGSKIQGTRDQAASMDVGAEGFARDVDDEVP